MTEWTISYKVEVAFLISSDSDAAENNRKCQGSIYWQMTGQMMNYERQRRRKDRRGLHKYPWACI